MKLKSVLLRIMMGLLFVIQAGAQVEEPGTVADQDESLAEEGDSGRPINEESEFVSPIGSRQSWASIEGLKGTALENEARDEAAAQNVASSPVFPGDYDRTASG